MMIKFIDGECKCRFKQDTVFNQKTISFIGEIMELKEAQLISDGEVLASVPVSPSGIGEWSFFGGCFPYVDYKWFCDDIKHLEKMEELMKEDVPLDIVNVIIDRENRFNDDYGIGLVQTNSLEDFYLTYGKSTRKSIKRTMRNKAKDLTYKLSIPIEETKDLLEYWFELYENDLLDMYKKLFKFWVDENMMYVNGVYLDGEMVGADFILLTEMGGEKVACGILTPWLKENEKVLDTELGRYVIVEACGFLKEIGYDWFSLGDLSYPYKKKWSHRKVDTKVVGLGRWEWREDEK